MPNYHPSARVWAPEDDSDLAEKGIPLEQRPKGQRVAVIVPFRDAPQRTERGANI